MEDTAHEEHYYSGDLSQHVPNCDEELKPFVGRTFANFEAAIAFYRIYAEKCGFDIRRGTTQKARDGTIVRQYMYCNREGEKNALQDDVNTSKVKRRRVSNRVGCLARISFKFDVVHGCIVERFEEGHTHQLISAEFKKYMKVNRKMGYMQKNFLMNCARANIGPIKSYRLYKEMMGDYSEVGSIGNDWKNQARDRKAYIDGCDSQIILQKFALKKESCSAFFYDYSVDEKDNLTCLFWSDPIARRNCSVFGDVVSFDCTYGTNRYNMIFAPFTGKDNHGKIVTFGAALMSSENNNMYAWVFERFKDCMGRAPRLIITDQDPAIKIAIERVYPQSTHRLCMWHIMQKVPEKIPDHLKKNEDFRQRLNAVVWSDFIAPHEFEKEWKDIMAEFDLLEDNWFSGLYNIRGSWIPAYFRDIPMSGICRTTSISESVNNFFSNYLSRGSNLVEFFMHFDSAMDAQRQTNDFLNSMDRNSVSTLKTKLSFEKHAATVYTANLFIKVQEEIEASLLRCSVNNVEKSVGITVYEVDESPNESFTVKYNNETGDIVCGCNKFVRDGILCCHIFLLFKQLKWSVIPERYLIPRWTKAAYSSPLYDIGDVSLGSCIDVDDNKKLLNTLLSAFYDCVGVVEGNKEKIQRLIDAVCSLKDELVDVDGQSSPISKNQNLFDSFYGVTKPDEIQVHPPIPVKTKGSGSRLKSRREAAIERAKKPPRMCSKCKKLSHHDARNCTA